MTDVPVWVLKWACRDFSLGKTRLQYVHLMELGDEDPCRIRVLSTSALGRPLLVSLGESPEADPGLCKTGEFSTDSDLRAQKNLFGGVKSITSLWQAPALALFGVRNILYLKKRQRATTNRP